DDLSVREFHDADRVRRRAVITEDEFADPQVATADDPLDPEALLARLYRSALLDVAAATDALAGLRIMQNSIVAINLVLGGEVIRVGCGPVAFERRPYL